MLKAVYERHKHSDTYFEIRVQYSTYLIKLLISVLMLHVSLKVSQGAGCCVILINSGPVFAVELCLTEICTNS